MMKNFQSLMYVLDKKGLPKNEPDVEKWRDWFIKNFNKRTVKRTDLANHVFVSTVFTGFDMGMFEDYPLLYETRVFGGSHNSLMYRDNKIHQAISSHNKLVKKVKNVIADRKKKALRLKDKK